MKLQYRKVSAILLSVVVSLAAIADLTVHADKSQDSAADQNETLYHAYSEKMMVQGYGRTGLRVEDGREADGRDHIVYCHDVKKEYPTPKDNQNPTMYRRVDNYLQDSGPFTEAYGENIKQMVALALYAGYPHDAYGLREEFQLEEDEARWMTQQLIWDITEGYIGSGTRGVGVSDGMKRYYNKIYHDYIETRKDDALSIFDSGYLHLDGDFSFREEGQSWKNGPIQVVGMKGELTFQGLPDGMQVLDADTGEPLHRVAVDQSFCLRSDTKPKNNDVIRMSYEYERVRFYLYSHHSGGYDPFQKGIQNLIRIEPLARKMRMDYQVSMDGTVTPPKEPNTPDDTPPKEPNTPDAPPKEPDTPDAPPKEPDTPDEAPNPPTDPKPQPSAPPVDPPATPPTDPPATPPTDPPATPPTDPPATYSGRGDREDREGRWNRESRYSERPFPPKPVEGDPIDVNPYPNGKPNPDTGRSPFWDLSIAAAIASACGMWSLRRRK